MMRLYTEEDIQRWEDSTSRRLEILGRRLGNDPASSPDAQGINMLSLSLLGCAFTYFAKGQLDEALDQLRSAVRLNLVIFQRYSAGDTSVEGYIRTGEFQTLLLGFASGDLELARRFAQAFCIESYAVERSPEDSNYIGLPMKSLALGDIDEARDLLSRPRPTSVDSQFAGYIECLSAIANRNPAEFRTALSQAELHWHKFMAKRFRGHPQSAFFVAGLGFQRLAETILG